MIKTPNLDQLLIEEFARGPQIRICDFCLDCLDFGHFCRFSSKNEKKWPKMAKICAIEAQIKNPDLWPSAKLSNEQLVQIWGLYHYFWRRYIFSKIRENAVKISMPWSSPYVFENTKLNISTTK